MKTVLFLVNHDMTVYNIRFELVKALRDRGDRVVISSPMGERIKLLEEIGCEFIETNVERRGTNPITDIGLFLKYVTIVKKVKPDMVFSYTIKPNIYGGMACALVGAPYVATITGLGTAVENGGALQKLTLALYKVALKKAKRVFFENNENRRFFEDKKIALGKHHTLPGAGVNLTGYQYIEYPNDEITRFAFISRVMKAKGIDEYLQTAEYIKSKYPNTEFNICGFCEEDIYEQKLTKLHSEGIINYRGVVFDIREIHKDSHCTVLPSYHEGMSNVLLESAASGRPVITTDRPGCRETVEDGVSGFICQAENAQDLIAKVEKFLQLSYEEKKEMGIKGREKAEKEFDRNIVVEASIKEID